MNTGDCRLESHRGQPRGHRRVEIRYDCNLQEKNVASKKQGLCYGWGGGDQCAGFLVSVKGKFKRFKSLNDWSTRYAEKQKNWWILSSKEFRWGKSSNHKMCQPKEYHLVGRETNLLLFSEKFVFAEHFPWGCLEPGSSAVKPLLRSNLGTQTKCRIGPWKMILLTAESGFRSKQHFIYIIFERIAGDNFNTHYWAGRFLKSWSGAKIFQNIFPRQTLRQWAGLNSYAICPYRIQSSCAPALHCANTVSQFLLILSLFKFWHLSGVLRCNSSGLIKLECFENDCKAFGTKPSTDVTARKPMLRCCIDFAPNIILLRSNS